MGGGQEVEEREEGERRGLVYHARTAQDCSIHVGVLHG